MTPLLEIISELKTIIFLKDHIDIVIKIITLLFTISTLIALILQKINGKEINLLSALKMTFKVMAIIGTAYTLFALITIDLFELSKKQILVIIIIIFIINAIVIVPANKAKENAEKPQK
jgi:hypothetical protein